MLETIKTEADVTGEAAKAVRKKLGLNQRDFWNAVGVSQSAGCRFETERNESMVAPIRTLVFVRYFADLDIDASTVPGVKRLRALAKLQKSRCKSEPGNA